MMWVVTFTSPIALEGREWVTRAWCWFRQTDRKFICIPEQVGD